jgi:hypothetical protein
VEDRLPRKQITKKWQVTGVIVAVMMLAATPGRSALITNGMPDSNGASLDINGHIGAESFTLASTMTIRGIEFANSEYTPLFNDTLSYFIYSNNGFFPDQLLAQGTNPQLSKTFLVNGGILGISSVLYDFNLNAPVTLGPGTYWIGLNFSGNASSSWLATQTPNAQLDAAAPVGTTNWGLGALQVYLGISDTPLVATAAPEPGSLTLELVGLTLVLFGRKRISYMIS